jgi:stalled ribosome rescue protein Dom34
LWRLIQDRLDKDDLEGAFRLSLDNQDDIYLIRLMMMSDDYLSQLTKATAVELTKR